MPLNAWCPRYFHFLGLSLSAYSLFLYVGATIFLVLFARDSARRGYPSERDALKLGGLVVLGSVLFGGALSRLLTGTFALYMNGAALGAGLTALVYCRVRRLSPLRVGDAAAPAAALALVVMKLGCLVGGCCYGTLTEGSWFTAYVHTAGELAPKVILDRPDWELRGLVPVQLGVAGWALGIFLLLTVLAPRLRRTPGCGFALGLGLYGAGRFALDFWSGERALSSFLGLSAHQGMTLAMTAVAVAVWSFARKDEAPGASKPDARHVSKLKRTGAG